MTTEPPLSVYVSPGVAPQTLLVFASLAAATLVAAYGLATGTAELVVAGSVAMTGPLVGMGYLDNRARELEDSHA